MPDKYSSCGIYPCKWKTSGLVENSLNGKWKKGKIETCIEENLWMLKFIEDIKAKMSAFAFQTSFKFQLTSKKLDFYLQTNRIIIKTKELEIHMTDIKTEDGVNIMKFLKDSQKSSNTNDFNERYLTPLKSSTSQPFSPINSSLNKQFSSIKKILKNEENNNLLDPPLLLPENSQSNMCLTSSSFYSEKLESTPFGPSNSNKSKRKPGLLSCPELDLKRPKLIKSYLTKQATLDQMRNVKASTSLQGFSNLGNTCYMNSILQSLFCIDPFATNLNDVYRLSSYQNNQHLLHISLGQLLQSSLHQKYDNCALILSNVKESICKTAKRFIGNEQHDAHEFLGQLLDQLSEEVEKINQYNLENNIIPKLDNPSSLNFESTIKQKITCSNCSFANEMTLTQNDISVNISSEHKLRSIQDCLGKYFEEQNVEFTCEKCSNAEGRVSYSFLKVPRVLIILLKRYQYSSVTSTQEKIASKISIPKFVSIKDHCTVETIPPMSAPFPCRESFKNQNSNKKDNLKLLSNQRMAFSDKSNSDVHTPRNFQDNHVYEVNSPSVFNENNSSYSQYVDFDEARISGLSEEEQVLMAIERSKDDMSPKLDMPIKNYYQLFEVESINPHMTNEHNEFFSPDPIFDTRKQLNFSSDWDTPKHFPNNSFASDMDVDTNNKENVEPSFYEGKIDITKSEEPNTEICSSVNINGLVMNNNVNFQPDKLQSTPKNVANHVINGHVNNGKESGSFFNYSKITSKTICKKNYISSFNDERPNGVCSKNKLATDLNDEAVILHHQSNVEPMDADFIDFDTNISQFDSDLKRAIELSLSMNYNNELEESDIKTNNPDNEFDEETKSLTNNFETGDLPFSYQLVSVVSHLGSASSVGHYVADIYDVQHKRWNLCDDSCVTSISEEEVRLKRAKTGYIFFYLAKDLMSDLEDFYKQVDFC